MLHALGAIALWATLASWAWCGARAALPAHRARARRRQRRPLARQWRVPLPTLALGVYGLFGFHFLLVALRHAPPLEANLVNYLGCC